MQAATCAFIGASCEALTFDILNKTKQHSISTTKHKKQRHTTNLQKTFQVVKNQKDNDIKLTFATKKCQYV
jgi:hypothetical protein